MSSVTCRRPAKAVCFCSLIFGVTLVPALATTATITLVPAITTVTGNGAQGTPGNSPTLASSSQNISPVAITTDDAGNIYFSDGQYNVVWKINRATGIMAIFAGQPGGSTYSGDGGPATSARFRGPQGLKFDRAGNLYIVDSGNSIVRKVDHVSGNISTIAGTPHAAGSTGDGGLATSAKLVGPSYIAFDSANNLYIADSYGNSIRRVDAVTQIITTVAGDPTSARAPGQSGDGGPAASALLHNPNGLGFDKAGNLFIADRGNNAIRRIDAVTQNITTVAGDPTSARASGATGDGGPATNALLNFPWSVEVDQGGNLFIADYLNNVVREVTNDGNINTIAGTIGSGGFSGDGGAATAGQLTNPADVAFDTDGNAFIVDPNIGTVRAVNLNSTFPSTAVGATSASQNLVLHITGTFTITGFTVPPSPGGLPEYVAGSLTGTGCSVGAPIVGGTGIDCLLAATFRPASPGLRRVPLAVATTINSTPQTFQIGITGLGLGPLAAFDSGVIQSLPIALPQNAFLNGVTVDSLGNLYMVDGGRCTVDKYAATGGAWTVVAGNGSCASSHALGVPGPAVSAQLSGPWRVVVSGRGDLYIADTTSSAIFKVDALTGNMTVYAGTIGSHGHTNDGAPAAGATLYYPAALALDVAGNLYFTDDHNQIVQRVDAITGVLSTVAGNYALGAGHSGDGGSATSAQLNFPLALAFDDGGNLYISDNSNNVIRKVAAASGVISTVAGIYPSTCNNSGGGYSGDGGLATSTDLCDPEGISVDPAGNLYIADSVNLLVRKVNPATGLITTAAGHYNGGLYGGSETYTGDGGAANLAGLSYLEDVAVDGSGNFYIADSDNNKVRKVSPASGIASFGSINIGASSSALDVTLNNSGNQPLTLSALSSPADFNLSVGGTTCTSTISLATAAGCVLGIEFLPTVSSALSETLTVVDNQGTQTISLNGTGLLAMTTTTLTLAPNPPVGGGNVTLIATITPTPTGSPLGTVTFRNNGSAISGAVSIDASGVATFEISNLPAATYSWTAAYSGTANRAASTSAPVALTVASSVVTGTTLVITPAASVNAGTAVTLTATVVSNSLPVYPGTVLFCDASAARCDGSAVLGSASLTSSGIATFKFIPGFGTYSIKAVYPGVGTDIASKSASAAQTLTINGIASYLSFTSIGATGVPGDYTLTGTVSAFGSVAPSGSVNFLDTTASTTIGSAALDPTTLRSGFVQASGSPILLQSIVQDDVGWEATGDFNHDGIPDLAVIGASNTSSRILVLLGTGDGTFQAPVPYGIGQLPAYVTVADVNSDGYPDIIVANTFSGNVGVLLGAANGTFGAQATFPVGSGPSFVAVGDVNGDGIPDLVVANTGDKTIGVLLGDGTGRFAPQVTYPVGAANGIAIGDFNGDGKPDLAVSNAYVYPSPLGSVSVLMGAGDGTFAAATTLAVPAGVSPSAVIAADLRKNGTLDLVFADSGQSINRAAPAVYVMLGNNNGTFAAIAAYPAGDNAQSVAAGDINHDGILDLAVSDSGSDGGGISVSVLIGKGDGTFGGKSDYPVGGGGGPYNAVLADFNGDGLLDISTANYSGRSVTTLLQQQTETATLNNAHVAGTGAQLADASFAGDASHAGSVSSTTALTPTITTATTLTSSSPAIVLGGTVIFTATITPAPTGSTLGTVNFYGGGVLLGSGSVAVNSSGVATYSTTSLTAGADAITAVYSGNAGYSSSTSTAITETVTAVTSTISILTVAPNPVVAGQSATFTLTISPAPTGSPLGTVSFHNGPTLLGTGSVNSSGVATFSTTTLPVGTDSITAVYSGNAAYSSSTSTAITETVTAVTSTVSILTVAPNPVVVGQSATFTLTISPAPTGSPLGTVSFHNGPTLLGTGSVNSSGVATFSTTTLPLGTDSITAAYSGNAAFAGSTSTAITIQVNSANATATATAISSSNLAPTYGQSITLTATVTPAPSGTPPGTVGFYAGATLLGAQALNAHGVASLNVSLPLGPNAVTAVYSGSADFAGSTSGALSVSARALSAITLSASPTTQLATMPIAFTAQVNSAATGVQTGTVSFLNGSTVLGTVAITAGRPAVYSNTSLSSGTYSVTASYSGDGNFLPAGSMGAPVSITVSDLDLALGGDNNKSVVPGGAVTYNFPLSPVVTSTFIYSVALTATGLPPGATYTFSPSTIPAGSGTLPVAFTVQTAKTTAMLHSASGSSRNPWFALVFGLLLPLAGAKRFRARLTRMLLLLLFSALSLGLVAGLGGCGSGGFFGPPQGQTSYTITINATSGTLVRTSTVQLKLE